VDPPLSPSPTLIPSRCNCVVPRGRESVSHSRTKGSNNGDLNNTGTGRERERERDREGERGWLLSGSLCLQSRIIVTAMLPCICVKFHTRRGIADAENPKQRLHSRVHTGRTVCPRERKIQCAMDVRERLEGSLGISRKRSLPGKRSGGPPKVRKQCKRSRDVVSTRVRRYRDSSLVNYEQTNKGSVAGKTR